MASPSTTSRTAVYPLTEFDSTSATERTTFVTGWLVEGEVDAHLLKAALSRLTEKWRALAGRLEARLDEHGTSIGWQLRIPLDTLPETYEAFKLTTTISTVSLSSWVKLPITTISPKLPYGFFMHPSTPIRNIKWATPDTPLLAWHSTYFPPEDGDTETGGYTCIGFARAHGVFDGIGAALIVEALQAEINHTPWNVPSLPHEGLNANALVEALSRLPRTSLSEPIPVGASNLRLWGLITLILHHLWEKWWHQCEENIVMLPKNAMDYLIASVRADLSPGRGRVSTGDVLTGWLMKTIYGVERPSQKTVNWSNMASFRSLVFEPDTIYPHNAFIPAPCPLFTIESIQNTPLPDLCQTLADVRHTFSSAHIFQHTDILKTPGYFVYYDCAADERVLASNVSASRILEVDWSGIAKHHRSRTLTGYRYARTTTRMPFTNTVYISGRLPITGALVLDVFLRKTRMTAVAKEVKRLIRAAEVAASQEVSL